MRECPSLTGNFPCSGERRVEIVDQVIGALQAHVNSQKVAIAKYTAIIALGERIDEQREALKPTPRQANAKKPKGLEEHRELVRGHGF